ncbi:MAG: PAS domain-containing protein [Bacteroidetes bacterium]|nr:MAG: PAS domain-containing protein [Bacteroidota bacterium]
MNTANSTDHQKNSFKLILDAITSNVFVLDHTDCFTYVNPAFAQALQLSSEQLIGKSLADYLLSGSSRNLFSKGESIQAFDTLLLKKADESPLTLHMSMTRLDQDGQQHWLYQETTSQDTKNLLKDAYHEEVLDAIPDLLFVLDHERQIVGYHAPSDQMLVTPPSVFLGKKCSEFLPDDVTQIINEALDEADSKGSSIGKTYRLDKDGVPAWFELSIKRNDEAGQFKYIALSRDICSSKLNEIALAQSEARFRSVIEQSDEGIVLINEEGRIILWNRSQSKITGYTYDDVEDKFIWDVMFDMGTPFQKSVPGGLEQVKNRIKSILQKQDNQYIGQPMESEIVKKDGARRLLSTTLFPVEYSDQYLLGAIHHDITDIKKAELTLLENEAYIRTLYYDSPVPVLVIEEGNQNVFDLNNAALAAFGCKNRNDLVGKNVGELLPPENEDDLYFNRQQIAEKLELISKANDKTFDCHFRSYTGLIWDARVHTFRLSIYEKDLVQLTLIDTTAHNKAMSALFESESRYRAVAENANAGIAIVDLEERIVFSNETLAKLLGYSKEEILGKPFSNYVPEATYNLMTEKTFQRFNGIIDQYEAEFYHSDGSLNTFSVSASPLFSSSMEMIGTVGVMIDITQQKKAAQKLVETSEQLQAILASMPDMIFILDRNGRYIDFYINQNLFPHQAYQPKKGQHVREIFGIEQAQRIEDAIQLSLSANETVVVSFDFFVDDHISHFEARLSPMSNDKVVSVVRDTTALVTLESELVFNNELMRMLTMLATRFINLPVNQIEVEINNALGEIGSFAGVDRVYIFDYDWDSDSMSNTFEWCSEDTLPAIAELQRIPNSVLPEWVSAHRKGRMTHIPVVADLNPDENLRQILEPQGIQSLITIPLMEGKNCLGYVGFDAVKSERSFTDSELSLLRIFSELLTNLKIRQRTDSLLIQNKEILQKQNEQLLTLNNLLRQQNEEIIAKNTELDIQKEKAMASDRLKTAFLNNVSHEVRTPLNGIIGFAQFLTDDSLSVEDKTEFVAAMNTSVSRLTDTINDIMDVSLLMSENMIVHPEMVDIKALMQDIYRKHEFEAKSKNLKLEMFVEEDSKHSTIKSDMGMLQKITAELVGNAIKYTQKGYVRFGYGIKKNELIIRVEDSGIGISKEAKNKIFEPFMQEDNSSTRKYEGSGLGLTIVKGLTELLRGQIELQSGQNEGTVITIKLPSMDQTSKETIVRETIKNEKAPTILIAEDEVLNVLYVKRILKNSGYNLLYAQNGEEAVQLVKDNPDINLVLMDIKMPIMDGLEATRIIRKSNEHLPIIAVTAYAANDDRHACIAAGCSDYISKPFTADDLKELIKKQYE